MAKEKKVNTRKSTYASSDDESSDDEIDYASLFKGLDRTKIDKINELIDARHTLARSGTRIVRRPTPTTKDSPPRPSTSRPSSPTSITHA